MNEPWDEVVRLSKEGSEAMPDSGQFASTRETQPLVEREAVLEAHKWLEKNKGFAELKSYTQPDPPDLVATLIDGTTVDYEFAGIIHQKTMQAIKHRRNTLGIAGKYQDWTPVTFQKRICELVSQKEQKFRDHLSNGIASQPLILVLGSDGAMTHPSLIDEFSVSSSIFHVVLVHLGYIPNPNGSSDSEYMILDITNQ